MKFRRIISMFTVAVMCFALVGCSGSNNNQTSETDGEVSEDTDGENVITLAESWDFSGGFYTVHGSTSDTNYGINYWSYNFYNTLLKQEDGEYVGELAEDWTVSDDGLTYTFTLRDGVKFSDGTPLTAEAVKTSFEASIAYQGASLGVNGMLSALIASMEAPDDLTFVMTLSQPYYGTLNDLTMNNPLGVVNPTAFNEDLSPTDGIQSATYGTGPYMYEGDTDGSAYTFVKNPYYWGDEPEIDEFVIKVIEENDAKVLALRSGEIDGIFGSMRLSYDAFEELSTESGYTTQISDDTSMTRYLGFNLGADPFDDLLVRQAVSYAIDQDTISTTVFQGLELPADKLFPSSKAFCDVDVQTYDYDIEKAKALLEEAGWTDSDGDGIREKDGQTLELSMCYYQDTGNLSDLALAIASGLEEIGVKVTSQTMDMMTWFTTVSSGECDLTLFYTYGGSYDPFNVMSNMNSATSGDPVLMRASTFFENGDDTIVELNSTADEERVQEIYGEVLGTMADEALVVPISYTCEFAAWNDEIIDSYDFYWDIQYIEIAGIHLK
ncbi:MAG: ABC transporter substrate-binding protein [Lachnospiraceae bacterium]